MLRGVDLHVRAGERLAIIGASGSGKTTLLQLLGGLDLPTSGTVTITGDASTSCRTWLAAELRNRALGLVYQFHHLLPEFTALENVCHAATHPSTIRSSEARSKRGQFLERVGLGARLEHRPGQLSGGERQRAAVARALVTQPPSCSPTSRPVTRRSECASQVFELMLELNRELHTALVIVTHAPELAQRMQRTLTLKDGKLVQQRTPSGRRCEIGAIYGSIADSFVPLAPLRWWYFITRLRCHSPPSSSNRDGAAAPV